MKFRKLLFIPLIAMSLCGCGEEESDVPTAEIYIKDSELHKVEGTTHDFEVDYNSSVKFITGNSTEYTIKCANNSFAVKAAKYIQLQIWNGFHVEIEYDYYNDVSEITSDKKVIVIGDKTLFSSVGLTKTTKDLGITGYEIQTKDNAIYSYAAGDEAYELIANTLLKELVGYDLLYGERIIFEKDGSVVPKMKIVEKPDFDYRKIDDKDTSWRYGAGFTDNIVFATINGIQYHTSFQYLPPEVYGWKEGVDSFNEEEAKANGLHPKWFADDTILGKCLSSTKGANQGTLCYTAHGDAEELALMQETVAEKIIEVFDANPSLYNLTFTIEDNYTTCDCDACMKARELYNDSIAATIVIFLNGVEDLVSAHYDEIARQTGNDKREYYICFFAYHSTEIAPVQVVNGVTVPCKLYKQDPISGQYIKTDENLVTNERVCVYLAPISSLFTHSFYDTVNADAAAKVKNWSILTKHIYCWLYETNFRNYFYPFNTFISMAETLRFVKSCGCSLIYMQDQHDTTQRSCFSRLKLYMMSKLMIDVNVNAQDLINRFFEKYYGKAAAHMREFFDEMTQWSMIQEINWPSITSGSIYNQYNNATVWKENMLRNWENLCYQAIDDIEYLKDVSIYEDMYNSIILESLFPRYVLLDLFSNSFTEKELRERQLAFKADCDSFGIDRFGESIGQTTRYLNDVYKTWGIL